MDHKTDFTQRWVLQFFNNKVSSPLLLSLICSSLKTLNSWPFLISHRYFSSNKDYKSNCLVLRKWKSACHDDFSFKLIKTFGSIYNGTTFFIDFFTTFLEHECKLSFIALIPMVNDLFLLFDYHPINLINIYKTISNRIKLVIRFVVGNFQSTFIVGMNILDGPVIINEIWHG